MRVKLSLLIDLLCLFGCLYQIYDITELYLQFKVRHDVAYDYSTHIELPAIDIMVPMIMAMNLTKLFAAYPEEVHNLCLLPGEDKQRLNYTMYNIEFFDQCFARIKSAPFFMSYNIFKFIKVKDIKEFTVDIKNYLIEIHITTVGFLTPSECDYRRYYNGATIFMRILCLNGTKPFSILTNFASLDNGIISRLAHTFNGYFGIRLSDHKDLPDFEESKYFIIKRPFGIFTRSTISYVKTVMSSLEYPYETNCRHYNKAKSLNKCITDYSLGQSTPYLFHTLIYEWNEHPDHLGFDPGDEIQRIDSFIQLIKCIERSIPIECDKTSYLIEGTTSSEFIERYGFLFIEQTWKANMYLSAHPVLPWSEYIIFIGSIIGLWFGISMHNLIFNILICIKVRSLRILKHRQQRNIKRCISQ